MSCWIYLHIGQFSVASLIAVPITTFTPESVLLSPMVTHVSASLSFFMFSSEFNICDMASESVIHASLSYSWFDIFAINSSSHITFSVTLYIDHFSTFAYFSDPFLQKYSIWNNRISSCYLCSCFYLISPPWFSSNIISWHVQVCCSNRILVL